MTGPVTLNPYICVRDATRAIDFYIQAFGAEEEFRLTDSSGKVGHAQLKIGDALFMLADEFPEAGFKSPGSLGGSPVGLHLQVADVDAVFAQALAAGATTDRPVENQFYGQRGGSLLDPFGHRWFIQSHIEDVSPQEMQKRMNALMDGG